MPCVYCNAEMPDENGICPNCGRRAPQPNADQQSSQTTQTDMSQQQTSSSTQQTTNEPEQFIEQHWRSSWLFLAFKLLRAIALAVAFGAVIWVLKKYTKIDITPYEGFEDLNSKIGLGVMMIPVLYLVWGTLQFLYSYCIKRYELGETDFRLNKGFFSRSVKITLLEAVWGMKLRQNLLDRILGTGKITLFSDDVDTPKIQLNDLGSVRKKFDDLVRYQEHALDRSNVKVEQDVDPDRSTYVWHYSFRDLIDEFLECIGFTAIAAFLYFFIPWSNSALSWVPVWLKITVLCIVPVLCWLWLAWYIIDKVWCTTYTLNNAVLIKESGVLHKKIDVYVLCQVEDCDLNQNLWQRMVGNVGNITLYLKWENKDAAEGESVSTIKKDELHGLVDYEDKFKRFRKRWQRERHRRSS